MRTAAGEGARRLTSLNAGDPVKVTGKTDDWYRIVLPFGATGFVLERLLGPASPLGDEIAPTIQIAEVLEIATDSIQLAGLVTDASRITEFIIQNEAVGVGENGAFQTTLYVPLGGLTVLVTAVDEFGNRAERTTQVARVQEAANAAFQFDPLNPTAQAVAANPNAVAIIIGVEGYENLPDATFANRDAQVFFDFAQRALGVRAENIRLLVNEETTDLEIIRAFRQWLPALVQPGQSDVYVFFAGHGLAAADGTGMFLMPQSAAVDLLDRTAIRRDDMFDWLQASGARTVTIFLDTCLSGGTRGEEVLVADRRGFGLSARDESVPTTFTLISAATGDQTSTSLPEAGQGLFSYFLMKGMEGGADGNGDNKINAGELHTFVAQNVARQAPRLATDQTPQITGDPNRDFVAW